MLRHVLNIMSSSKPKLEREPCSTKQEPSSEDYNQGRSTMPGAYEWQGATPHNEGSHLYGFISNITETLHWARPRVQFFGLTSLALGLVTIYTTVPFIFVPAWFTYVVFAHFGVVYTGSWAVTLTSLVAALVSLVYAILATWGTWACVQLAQLVFNTDQGKGVEMGTISNSLKVLEDSCPPGTVAVSFNGQEYSYATIRVLAEARDPRGVGLAWAVLYLPAKVPTLPGFLLGALVVGLMVTRKGYSLFKKWLRLQGNAWKTYYIAVWVGILASPATLPWLESAATNFISLLLFPPYVMFRTCGFRRARKAFKVASLWVALKLINFAYMSRVLQSRYTDKRAQRGGGKHSFQSVWNNTIISLARMVDNVSLPNFVRSLPDRFDRDAINETNQILEELGWPKAGPVGAEPHWEPINFSKYKKAFIGAADMEQGIPTLKLEVAKELENLKGLAPQYKRTEQYATVENELESLSRYFSSPDVDIPDLPVDEAWVLLGDIFRNSRLTAFPYIVSKWEKKYGLSPFYGDPDSKKRWKKLSRAKFIKSVGGFKEFVDLWAKTFKYCASLVPVAGISVKGEALPPKKWMADKVRTIVSSPLTHYISSTIWNFWPNHNFKFWSTNIKVGMPLNGANLSKLASQHLAYPNHFAGDFSDFDSTVKDKVIHLIAKIRKKGFESHRDYAKICFLIDANYSNLEKMPLLTTSTGNIYSKSTGLTTGHSSTSMDNSIAVTIYYLCAWRHITGLSAHEFRHYCKLSNYGDDHILSWLNTAPASWTGSNIQKAMSRFGVELRDEEPSRDFFKMQFLSKGFRRPTSSDMAELAKAGVPLPSVVVYHDPVKLVGKCYAPSRDIKEDRNYRLKRLVSYLDLCAHHKDLYDKIKHDIDLIRVTRRGKILQMPVPIPSYEDVLRKWYNPKSVVQEEDERYEAGAEVMDYSFDGLFDTVVNILSVVPDFVNPAIYNIGYTNHVVTLLAKTLSWPVELLRRANSASSQAHLVTLARRTPYSFLADSPAVMTMESRHSNMGLMLRHWLFIILCPEAADSKPHMFLKWADRKVADFNFALSGYVSTVQYDYGFPYYRLCLVALLSYLPDPQTDCLAMYVRLPSLSVTFNSATGSALNYVWSKVPTNMKQTNAALLEMSQSVKAVLIEAPTGTGKSTLFVNYVWKYHAHRYNRYIVVVPRQANVLSLAPWWRQAFNLPVHEVTEGYAFTPSMRLILCTPGELLLHPEWAYEGNLIQIDESHVEEPLVQACLKLCDLHGTHYLMTTATPSEGNRKRADIHVPLTIASTWVVEDALHSNIDARNMTYTGYWQSYKARCLDIVKAYPLRKILIFVVDVGQGRELASEIRSKTCLLSSQDKHIVGDAQVFITTSVADVGLTIPDVDWVITSNITRQSISLGGLPRVSLVGLGQATLTQRRGRTGRTNNGLFTLLRYEGLTGVLEAGTWEGSAIGLSLLQSGVSPSVVNMLYPEFWSRVSVDGDPFVPDQITLDLFDSNVRSIHTALEAQNQHSYLASADGGGPGEYWTIQGNTLSLATKGPDGKPKAKQLTVADAFKFFNGAALWAAQKGIILEPEMVTGYMRTAFLSAKSFIGTFKNGTEFLYFPEKGDPSGRFGRRGEPSRAAAVDDPFEGFPKFPS